MGHLLYKMACYEEFKETDSRENFVTKCQSRQYSDAFMIDYDEFMEKYAVRGMKEIDVLLSGSMRMWVYFMISY